MPVPAVGREHWQRAMLTVLLNSVRTSGACDAIDRCTPYGDGTFLTLCELERAVLVSVYISFEDAVAHCARSYYCGQFGAFRP